MNASRTATAGIQDISNKIFKSSLRFLPVMIVLLIVSFILYYAIQDPTALGSKAYIYSVTIIVPLTIAFLYFTFTSNSSVNMGSAISSLSNMPRGTFFKYASIVITLSFFIFLIQYLTTTESALIIFITNLMLFLIIVIGLAIIYNIFINYFVKLEGWSGFIANFLFYIPCLISDFIEWLKGQFHVTPNIVFILFILELIIILIYVYWPYLVKWFTQSNGIPLLKDPVFLDSKIQLVTGANIPMMKQPTYYDVSGNVVNGSASEKQASDYYRNYAITMWIYMNSQSGATQIEQTVFEYDNTNASVNLPKPVITYYTDPSNNVDTYLVYFTTPTSLLYTTSQDDDAKACRARITGIPFQRWNQFAFNYNNNIADLFINGELVRSFNYSTNFPIYGIYDQISVGQNNGLAGSICSVIYYTRSLTNMEIANAYNVLQYSNPPLSV